MTVKEVCLNAQRLKEQCVYVYGAKYEVVTEALIQRLSKENPSVYNDSYISKCRKKIGKIGIDCSGLVCKASGLNHIGSYNMKENWKQLDKPCCGAAAWKPGHIAIVTSVTEGGNKIGVIEAKGVDYDCQYNIYNVDHFKCYLAIPSIQYVEEKEENTNQEGWEQDDKGQWRYKDNEGNYYKNRIVRIKWDKGQRQDYFSFDHNGIMMYSTVILCKVDENGCIVDVKDMFEKGME